MKCFAVLILASLLGAGVGWAQQWAAPFARYFRIEWEIGQTRAGQPLLRGYLYNQHPSRGVANVVLQVEELDSARRPVSQTTGYVTGEVHPGDRGYFEVRVPSPRATYRVSVELFDWARRPAL